MSKGNRGVPLYFFDCMNYNYLILYISGVPTHHLLPHWIYKMKRFASAMKVLAVLSF